VSGGPTTAEKRGTRTKGRNVLPPNSPASGRTEDLLLMVFLNHDPVR